jgi:hypothetical protein
MREKEKLEAIIEVLKRKFSRDAPRVLMAIDRIELS